MIQFCILNFETQSRILDIPIAPSCFKKSKTPLQLFTREMFRAQIRDHLKSPYQTLKNKIWLHEFLGFGRKSPSLETKTFQLYHSIYKILRTWLAGERFFGRQRYSSSNSIFQSILIDYIANPAVAWRYSMKQLNIA